MTASFRTLDDAMLVRAVQDGDHDAFSELYRRHFGDVRGLCVRRLGNSAEAEEVAQAAFVRAFERIDQCGGDARFGGWVQVIAHRLCIDTRRAGARTMPEREPVDSQERAGGRDGPEETLLRHELVDRLNLALAALPARQREVMIARHFDGKGPAEIATLLGMSLGAVDSLLLRARRRMATVIDELADERR
jgi:RNA polymerase sigma-70 factor (ECF subfamily)